MQKHPMERAYIACETVALGLTMGGLTLGKYAMGMGAVFAGAFYPIAGWLDHEAQDDLGSLAVKLGVGAAACAVATKKLAKRLPDTVQRFEETFPRRPSDEY